MPGSILYCGDTDLTSAAGYLAGLMTAWGWDFDYVPSHFPFDSETSTHGRSLFIFSDYPAGQLAPHDHQAVVAQVQAGAGLLMIGGWESFHGFGGNWDDTPIGDALPVLISGQDDRTNFDQGAYLREATASPVTSGLPWRERPPLIGGMNRFRAKPDSEIVLEAIPLVTRFNDDGSLQVEPQSPLPAFVIGQHGKGKTAAFASDVAPHWVGGLVDWGNERVTAQASGAGAIEVGNWYAQFWKQLLESLVA